MKDIVHRMAALIFAALVTPTAMAQPSVLTQDYDMGRSGANLNESILTPSNVSSATFGKLFAYPVDEEVFAQPLYVPNLAIGGGTHNVVFVATMGNTVYAFDADSVGVRPRRSGKSISERAYRHQNFFFLPEAAFHTAGSIRRRLSIRFRRRSTS